MPPMDELLHDLGVMRDLGFNLVKLQVNWATTEAIQGRLDLERFHLLIRRAAEVGLRVYLGFVCEHAPAWLYRRFPDCRMETRLGVHTPYEAVSTLPADGKPGPCFDHPGANAAMLDWLRRATAELAAHSNIGWWNTWQEVEWWAAQPWLLGDDACYCPHSLAAFRRFLRAKYRTITALNREWRSFHASFEDIVPTRTARGRDGQPVDLAWMDFQRNYSIARTLRERAEAVRKSDPLRRPIFAHKAVCDIGAGADLHAARAQDFFGFSAYATGAPFHEWDDGRPRPEQPAEHAASLTAEAWQSIALAADHLRACTRDGQVWAAELQGGPVCPAMHRGRTPDAADIRRWMLLGLGHGLTGIAFWVLREEIHAAELCGFGLLDGTGDTTPRAIEAGRLARAIARHADLFAVPNTPPAELAIVVDDRNARSQRCNINAENHHAYDVRGWHRLCFDLGIAVDFLHVSDFTERAARYRALVLPLPICLGDDVASELRDWVETGGQLLAEACPGRVGADNYAVRGGGSEIVRSLFGARQGHFRLVREAGGRQRWTPPERTWGDVIEPPMLRGVGPLEGLQLQPQWLFAPVVPEGAEPVLIADDGAVVGVRHGVGHGAAWQIGTVLGFRGTADRSLQGHAAIARLLAALGVRPAHEGRLLLRRRGNGRREAWCFFNPSDNAVSETVRWPTDTARLEDLLEGPMSVNDPVAVPALDVRIFIVYRR